MPLLTHCVLAAFSLFGLFGKKEQATEPAPPAKTKPATTTRVREVTRSPVVDPAPDFALAGTVKARTLRSLRGQAAVVLFAQNARTGAFRKQLKELAPVYQEFAGRSVVFIAALQNPESPVKSDIPFVLAADGAGTAAKYAATDRFHIAIIGPDGNIDYQTPKVLPGGRVRDVIQNSFAIQNKARRR